MARTMIAIPCYNAENFIERTLNSCLVQTIPCDILVVDNCSTDNSVDIVKRFQGEQNSFHLQLEINQTNLGRIGNWNRCLDLFEKSDFEYIKFLFMGDELLPNCIEKLEEIIEHNADVVSISWPYLFNDINGRETLSPKEWETSRDFTKEELVEEGYFPGNFLGAIIGVSISKKAILNNRFDELMLGIVPFYDRVLVRGKVYYYSEPLTRFNLDSHRSFAKSLSYHIVFESAFAKANDLEINKDWIKAVHYDRIKDRIMISMIKGQVPYFSCFFWLKVWLLLPSLILRKIFTQFKKWLKPKLPFLNKSC